MDREAYNLRRELAGIERGRWYPLRLRERITKWTRRRRAEGASLREMAAEIAMPWQTVLRWSAPSAP
jgi:hypothetical protein